MSKWKNDIKRYLAGEMTSEEQHALEKKALSDPFLYEALEGVNSLSGQELNADLDELTFRIKERSSEKIHEQFAAGAVASKRFSKAPVAESIAADSSQKEKNKKNWLWPLRIAASVALLIVGYFAVTPFFEKEVQFASNEQKLDSDSIQNNRLIDSVNKTDGFIALSEKKEEQSNKKSAKATKTVKEQKPKAEVNSQAGVSQPLPVEKLNPEKADEISTEQIAELITESAVVEAQDKKAEIKKEAPQVARSKSIVQSFTTNQKVIKGKVVSADDGTPLPGVNIVVKGTTTGTVTDMQGAYKLVSDVQQPTLVYSFIGLQTEEVKVTDQKEVTVNLQTDVSQLSEVVVTGYSSAKDLDHEPVVKLAEPEGGRRAYDKYLKNTLQYPQEAIENKIKGRVTIQFTVATDGSLSEFTLLRGLGYGCDEEVIRLVKEGPKWAPTTEDNVAVESEVRVRVKFAPAN
jgi:TonB family protein